MLYLYAVHLSEAATMIINTNKMNTCNNSGNREMYSNSQWLQTGGVFTSQPVALTCVQPWQPWSLCPHQLGTKQHTFKDRWLQMLLTFPY